MRVAGLAGQILAKLGVVPQQIGGADIYPALEKGTIDAAEWVGPYDDEKLGFYKVAKYYYYPGWWEGSAQLSVYVNAKQWASLPKPYQEALEVACAEAERQHDGALRCEEHRSVARLVSAGAQLRAFPRPVMEACYNVAQDLYAEFSAKNPEFKKIYASWNQFRDDQYLWFRVAENSFDNFVLSIKKPKK